MKETKQTEIKVEILNIDKRLHKAIVNKYMKLITLDVVLFTVLAIVLGIFTFKGGFHLIPGIFSGLCVLGLIWNLGSLLKIMMKKYGCYLVTVDKVWEENGVYMCRITPDTYGKYDFTGALTIKNYTKKYKDVKAGDKVIVAAGSFSRYIYLFDYEGEQWVTDSFKLAVAENTSYAKARTSDNIYDDVREVSVEGVGKVTFKIKETEDGIEYEHQEGLNDSFFGPHYIIAVAECSIPEERFDDTIAAIEATYRNSSTILESFYSTAIETIASQGIMPPSDKEIDRAYIQEDFIIKEMDVIIYDELLHGKEDIEIHLYGNVEADNGKWLLPDKTFLINISCMSGDVTYEMKDF